MAGRPTGTVTFLFTDVEGSTRLWEEHPNEMQAALARHDEILRSSIERSGGYVFSTAGDAFAAAFTSADDAVAAAVAAQRSLETELWRGVGAISVRMGLHTGGAEERDGNYFGPTLNRAARVMSAGHGGQVLMSAATAALVTEADVLDLGKHRLKDLDGAEHLFQVRASGLRVEFGALRTVEDTPGNLPAPVSALVGRQGEVAELRELVKSQRLVTLTGVGGVGKTRLAIEVAASSTASFPDGVWMVELAPVGDPAAVPAAVAATLGVSVQADVSIATAIGAALSGRRMLILLDNCEHVVDAAADLVETVLASADGVRVLATSREGLRVEGERIWTVPPLDTRSGSESAAVELFVERARAVNPAFDLGDDADIVAEVCARLDGIALAIELAAARMVSMTPSDVRDRLGDRFRMLSGSRRAMDRHQTLRHAVAWSYDLLTDDERMLLNRCSVFADGFVADAAAYLCGGDIDEFEVLDLLDSLVRKSLLTTERVAGHIRYGLLETIRQFAEDELVATSTFEEVRRLHATYFAERVEANFVVWDGPGQRAALDWVDIEFANLRMAFRWSADHGDLPIAASIAAHAAMLGWLLQRYEPVGWAEEILPAAASARVSSLPRLYSAASLCSFTGRAEAAVGYVAAAKELRDDGAFDPFGSDWELTLEGLALAFDGRSDRWMEVARPLAADPDLRHAGLTNLTWVLPIVGRDDEARELAAEAVASARASGNPFWITWAVAAHGRTFTAVDPARALREARTAAEAAREHRIPFLAAVISREAAAVEAVHGQLEQGLAMYEATLDALHRVGAVTHLRITLANMVVFFDRFDHPEIAATLLGVTGRVANMALGYHRSVERVRAMLGDERYDELLAAGAAMDTGVAVLYAREQIAHIQAELSGGEACP